MKSIAIVTLAVALEEESGLTRFRTLAEMLSEKYHVDLITSSFHHWSKQHRDQKKTYAHDVPYRIILADEPGYKKNIDVRRIISNKFLARNILKIIRMMHYDLIYCTIPDNYIAAQVSTYAKKNGIPVIIDIEDLWPEAMEMISPFPDFVNKLIFWGYRRSARTAYRNADAFVGTSDEYRDVPKVKYGIEGKPAITVYVGSNLDEFDAGVREYKETIEKGEGEFWVTYAGSLGSSYDIPTLIRAGQLLYAEGQHQIKIKILGSGPLEQEFRAVAAEKGCHVDFLGYVPYRKMAAYLAASDVVVNSYVKKAPQSIVTKIGDYLASGKPMINTLDSQEFSTKVVQDGFGVNISAEDDVKLKEEILTLYCSNEMQLQMGKSARMIAEKEFDRKISYTLIQRTIESITIS